MSLLQAFKFSWAESDESISFQFADTSIEILSMIKMEYWLLPSFQMKFVGNQNKSNIIEWIYYLLRPLYI